MTLFALLSILLMFGYACSKSDDGQPDVQIDEKNLTDCPANANCTTIYQDNKEMDSLGWTKTGSKRLFTASVIYPGVTNKLYISVPMNSTSFSLGKADVLKGGLGWITACPACNMIGLKQIDGYAKGRKLSGDNNNDKWILEAKIIRQAIDGSSYKDTLYVKQYFYKSASSDVN